MIQQMFVEQYRFGFCYKNLLLLKQLQRYKKLSEKMKKRNAINNNGCFFSIFALHKK